MQNLNDFNLIYLHTAIRLINYDQISIICISTKPSPIQIMTRRLFGANAISEPRLISNQRSISKCRLQNGIHVFSGSVCQWYDDIVSYAYIHNNILTSKPFAITQSKLCINTHLLFCIIIQPVISSVLSNGYAEKCKHCSSMVPHRANDEQSNNPIWVVCFGKLEKT